MRQAAVVFTVILALICIYWTFDYFRRRGGWRRGGWRRRRRR